MRKLFILILISLIVSSCNYKFLINKNRVYNSRSGYLIFHNRQKLFFPAKHIKGNDFFTQRIKEKGYLIYFDKMDETLLLTISEKYPIEYEYSYNGQNIFLKDTIAIIPVTVESRPMTMKSRRGEGELVLKYHNVLKRLKYYGTNNEAVSSIYPVLKEDQDAASDYYSRPLREYKKE